MSSDPSARVHSESAGSSRSRNGKRPPIHAFLLLLSYAALFFFFFYLAAFFGQRTGGGEGGSMWYPPAGLRTAALVIFGWAVAPVLAVAEILAIGAYGWLTPSSGFDDPIRTLLAAFFPLFYGLGLYVLSRFQPIDPEPKRLADVAGLLAIAVVCPLLGAAVTRWIQLARGIIDIEMAIRSIGRVFIGDTVGILMLTPILLLADAALKRRRRGEAMLAPFRAEGRSPIVLSALVVDLLILWTLLFVLHGLPTWFEGFESHVHWYLAFLPLIWIAFRHGLPGSVAAVFVLAGTAAWLISLPVESIHFHELQLLVLFVSMVSLLMGAAISTQRQSRRELAAAQDQLRELLKQRTSEVRALTQLLPMCSSCKKIRDDGGYWNQIEAYLAENTDTHFSHGLCPDCEREIYEEAGLELERAN